MNPPPLRSKASSTRKVASARRTACSACGSHDIAEVLALPHLPLTGVFVDPADRENFPSFDQALMRCDRCGHVQLRDSVDPLYLYQDTYTHRSSLSPISTRGNDFFLGFLNRLTDGRTFDAIAEIGCNDLYLLRKIAHRSKNLTGFDPIWKDRAPADSETIRVFGKYIEEIDPCTDLPVAPDLVLSVHTLEHVNDPLATLRPIFNHAKPGALFVVEVPSLDTLLTIGRFDQVFHQHLNYFSVASFRSMIRELGGQYVAHQYNYHYWLGTMLIAFRKPDAGQSPTDPEPLAPAPTVRELTDRHTEFRAQLAEVKRAIDRLRRNGTPIVGFGGAQMVPTLAYHMQTDLGFLEAIVDDNELKAGLSYPSIAACIQHSSAFTNLEKYAVLVTACDSARTLVPRLISLNARYILNPCNPF